MPQRKIGVNTIFQPIGCGLTVSVSVCICAGRSMAPNATDFSCHLFAMRITEPKLSKRASGASAIASERPKPAASIPTSFACYARILTAFCKCRLKIRPVGGRLCLVIASRRKALTVAASAPWRVHAPRNHLHSRGLRVRSRDQSGCAAHLPERRLRICERGRGGGAIQLGSPGLSLQSDRQSDDRYFGEATRSA